ncbi:hypothetical protein LCGC14_0575840 [marine sediment metagenome]|uniref:Uncharacterized protein n=1 Tax=marine sediment metagenome TaxID=412755 RepID=A0A0F9U476_9ZZZZ
MSRIVSAGPGLHIGDYMLAQTIDRGKVISRDPKIIEGHRLEKVRIAGKDVAVGAGLKSCACDRLEIDWLPFAAAQYHISADIENYVICEIFSVVADIPNRNLDCFSFDELTSWRTMIGRPAYKSFVGKPCHTDHDNQDDTKAKGVIFDSNLVPLATARGGRTIWAVKILKGFDRSKDERLARLVQQRNRIGHSMGALVEQTECSLPWCRFRSEGTTTCDDVQGGAGKGRIIRKHLVVEQLQAFNFIEDSSVEDPANVLALTDFIWGVE